ncbi:MAG: aminotransferase class III-fold pyridoxal phosphate-dependent enzyme [Acidobacteria bacterium]|nr:aminotransferase class III-fold pyridoxal phosphate-dependent enzyme [Acidobacteriota bacterium]
MNRQALWNKLIADWGKKAPASKAHFERASRSQVRGGSHSIRLFEPFPLYDKWARGSKVCDLDDNQYVDFWQGHYTNILGHNPPELTAVLADFLRNGGGLQTGFPGWHQVELAEEICSRTNAERVRFTTSGSLATLYAVMLSRAFTRRPLVLKVSGGWHGSQPYLLKGITAYQGGLSLRESDGLHANCAEEIVTTRFNDVGNLEEVFHRCGEQIACFVMEPFIGEGGFMMVDRSYLQKARELTRSYGTVLILDEIISGFRFCVGSLASLYGVTPDLATYGKIIGGGLPLTALAGRADILELANPKLGPGRRVRAEGGTFSAHPSAVLAGLTMIRFLDHHKEEIYPRINRFGEMVRREVPQIFARFDIRVVSTGHPKDHVPGSSMAMLQFPLQGQEEIRYPEEVWNPEICDVEMREKFLRLAFVARGFHAAHGFGSACAAHSEQEIHGFLNAAEEVARIISSC